MPVKIHAHNSSGTQKLYVDTDTESGRTWLTLAGVYKGKVIQFDFDLLSRKKTRKLIRELKRSLKNGKN